MKNILETTTLLDRIKATNMSKIEMIEIDKDHSIGTAEAFHNGEYFCLVTNIYAYNTEEPLYNIHRRDAISGMVEVLVQDCSWENLIEDEYDFIANLGANPASLIGAILTDEAGVTIRDDLYLHLYGKNGNVVRVTDGTFLILAIRDRQGDMFHAFNSSKKIAMKHDIENGYIRYCKGCGKLKQKSELYCGYDYCKECVDIHQMKDYTK